MLCCAQPCQCVYVSQPSRSVTPSRKTFAQRQQCRPGHTNPGLDRGKLSTKSAQECSERSDLHFKMLKRKMRSVKCARYCSESSVSYKNRKNLKCSEQLRNRRNRDPASVTPGAKLSEKNTGFRSQKCFHLCLWSWYSSLLAHGTFLDMIMT